jgi:hypothetical protein
MGSSEVTATVDYAVALDEYERELEVLSVDDVNMNNNVAVIE